MKTIEEIKQELFNHFHDNHGFLLLDDDMEQILNIAGQANAIDLTDDEWDSLKKEYNFYSIIGMSPELISVITQALELRERQKK